MTNYTAAQRATLSLIRSLLITAVIAGLFSVGNVITTDGPIDWNRVLYSFALAVTFSIAHGLAEYFRPTDVALSDVIDAVTQALEKRFQPQAIQGPLVVVHPPPSLQDVPLGAQTSPVVPASPPIPPMANSNDTQPIVARPQIPS